MTDRIFLDGPAGRLEAVLGTATNSTATCVPRGTAVVAHPHPLYGGDMDNAVVTTVFQAFRRAGFDALRFNFRGVGASQGHHDDGRGELDDLSAALELAQTRAESGQVALAGYSFGAAMSSRWIARESETANTVPLRAALLLAPPTTHYDFEPATRAGVDLAFICGELDDFTPESARAQMAGWPRVQAVEVVPAVGHDLGTFADADPLDSAVTQALAALGLSESRPTR